MKLQIHHKKEVSRMQTKELLELLDNEEVIQKIKQIITQEIEKQSEIKTVQNNKTSKENNKIQYNEKIFKDKEEKLKKQISALNEEKKQLQALLLSKHNEYKKEIDSLENKNKNLQEQKEKLEEESDIIIEQLQEESDTKIEQLSSEVNNLKETKRILTDTIASISREKESLKKNIVKLKTDFQKLQNENTTLLTNMQQKEQEITKYKLELENMNKKSEYYKIKYQNIDKYFEAYLSLGENIHHDLERVLSVENPETFFCYGVQWTNIEALWELISFKLNKYNSDEISILSSIFDYFFTCYESINTNYERLIVKIGDEFDEDIHTRASNSAVTGNIKEILLKGYKGIRNGKIKKSIVRM